MVKGWSPATSSFTIFCSAINYPKIISFFVHHIYKLSWVWDIVDHQNINLIKLV
jgi:hypothetical protein